MKLKFLAFLTLIGAMGVAGPILAQTTAVSADPTAAVKTEFRALVRLAHPGHDVVLAPDGGAAGRDLVLGEVWRDGWRLSAVAADAVTLRKGRQALVISLSDAPQDLAEVEPGAGGAGASVSVTNAVPGGSPKTDVAKAGPGAATSAALAALFADPALATATSDEIAARLKAIPATDPAAQAMMQRFADPGPGGYLELGSLSDGTSAIVRHGGDGTVQALVVKSPN